METVVKPYLIPCVTGTREVRRKMAAACGKGLRSLVARGCNFYLDPGDGLPRLTGHRAWYGTEGGTPIQYPNAYRKKGRVYRYPSTLRVHAGWEWALQNGYVPSGEFGGLAQLAATAV